MGLSKNKFVLTVGDEGAILVEMNAKDLVQRHFIESPDSSELTKILNSKPKVPVYLLVDVLDQAYIQHSLPPVSALNVGQLVKRRLEKDFADEDIKAARKLFREKDGRKDWNYSFISVHNAPPFSEWLDSVSECDNPFKGIYLLPIEAESFIKKLNLSFSGKDKGPAEWQLFISHNKVGGFRQIVFRDGKVIFTRIAQPIGGQAPDVIAGNIEQEALNTIEYVRRLGFDNDENLDIFVIASKSVKTALETNSLRARQIMILTPEEISTKFGLQNTAEKTDRFGDVVLSASFANSKPILRFSSSKTKKLEQVAFANFGVNISVLMFIPISIILSILTLGHISEKQDEIESAKIQKGSAQERLDEIMLRRGELPENSDQIVEVVDLYKTISEEALMPLDFVKKFAEIQNDQLSVEKFKIDMTGFIDQKKVVNSTFSTKFLNPSNNIDRLLEDLDNLTQKIREHFEDYTVDFSGLPNQGDNLSLGDDSTRNDEKELEISVKGPKDRIEDNSRNTRRRRR